MTAQGGLGIHFPDIYKKVSFLSRNLLPRRLVCNSEMPGLGKTSVVFLHCLLSVYDDGNCAVHRRRYGVCVCVCVCVTRDALLLLFLGSW